MFAPMAYTVGFAILGALAVALILIPGLSFFIYRKPRKVYHIVWLEKLTKKYRKFTANIIEKPRKVFMPVAGILVVTIILPFTVGKDFLTDT
jgi:cobalt-zinc-cadmium resistance protein CzcA